MDLYVLDLETTTEVEAANLSRKELLFEEEITFVCATMYAPIQPTKPKVEEFYGKNNAENAILELPEGRFYTWNGARFDLHYIYHLLRKAGYTEQQKTRSNESRKKQLKRYEYNYLLSGRRIISLNFKNDNGTIEMRDACLLFTCSLASFIKNTCPEYPKLVGTYDYKKYRITEDDFTPEEIEYCRYDVIGFSIGIHRIREQFQSEFDLDILESITAGSFAMKYAAIHVPEHKELFPPVNFDRGFVFGGRTFLNPIHAGKIITNYSTIDAKSFYPSTMVYGKLPYGAMKRLMMTSEQLDNFAKRNPDKYIFAKLMSGNCKYEDMYSPIVTLEDGIRDYPTHAGSADGVYIDDNVIRDPKFKHKGTWQASIFNAKVGILDYMSTVFDLKNRFKFEDKKALELAVKIILNSTFGKFIQRDNVAEYDFFDGLIQTTGERKQLNAWYHYAPMGAAITANCRYTLTKFMNLLQERFVYADTDSLTFYGECPPEIPLGTKLGDWELECSPTGIYNKKKDRYEKITGKSIFFQRKTYAKEIDGDTHLTFCGISYRAVDEHFNEWSYPMGVSIEMLQEEMLDGITFNVLQANLTKNGVVLVDRARRKKYVPKM